MTGILVDVLAGVTIIVKFFHPDEKYKKMFNRIQYLISRGINILNAFFITTA